MESGWIALQEEVAKLNSIYFLKSLINCFFTMPAGGGQTLRLSLPIRPRMEGNRLLSKWSSRRRFLINGGMKSPPPLPLSGMSFGTKLRHKKMLLSSSWSFIKLWQ